MHLPYVTNASEISVPSLALSFVSAGVRIAPHIFTTIPMVTFVAMARFPAF